MPTQPWSPTPAMLCPPGPSVWFMMLFNIDMTIRDLPRGLWHCDSAGPTAQLTLPERLSKYTESYKIKSIITCPNRIIPIINYTKHLRIFLNHLQYTYIFIKLLMGALLWIPRLRFLVTGTLQYRPRLDLKTLLRLQIIIWSQKLRCSTTSTLPKIIYHLKYTCPLFTDLNLTN